MQWRFTLRTVIAGGISQAKFMTEAHDTVQQDTRYKGRETDQTVILTRRGRSTGVSDNFHFGESKTNIKRHVS